MKQTSVEPNGRSQLIPGVVDIGEVDEAPTKGRATLALQGTRTWAQ
jgi:hypothetical protein